MVNAATSLFSLLTLKGENSLYLNTSIITFSLVSSINHVCPENLDGLTHIVKLLFSNLLFSLAGLNPIIGFVLSLIDTLPLLTENPTIKNYGEKILQYPRILLQLFLVSQIFQQNYLDLGIYCICKGIYFWERSARIKADTRNQFPMIHSVEHYGVFLLLKNFTKSSPELYEYILVFAFTQILLAIFLISFNKYCQMTYMSRIPIWFENDQNLIDVLKDKIEKNNGSKKWHNYIVKPMLLHLKLKIVTWKDLEDYCDELIKKIKVDEVDVVVGIKTGGYFVAKYISWKIKKPFMCINSKLWSGISMNKNLRQAFQFYKGEHFSPNITDIPEVADKRVLVVDDTSYTGMTMTNVVEKLKKEASPKDIKTLCIWIFGEYYPDYYVKIMRVPLLWEWGAEVD